jgi:7SK snRNA methylphosphate capping enzyme
MNTSNDSKDESDSRNSALSTRPQPSPSAAKVERKNSLAKNHDDIGKLKIGDKKAENTLSIMQKLVLASQSVTLPLKLPLEVKRGGYEEPYLQELLQSHPGLFQRPHPIGGIRTAIDVEHRGLGETRRLTNNATLRKKRHLYEISESKRKSLKNYYEQLLKELNQSNSYLGKRAHSGNAFNALGVPEFTVSPRDLLPKAKTFELGNYPTSIELSKTRLRALNDSSLFEDCRVLDLGCGDGSLLFEIAKAYKPCYLKGVDADSKLIESAATKARACLKRDGSMKKAKSETPDLYWVPLCFKNRCKSEINMAPLLTETQELSLPRERLPLFEAENFLADIRKYSFDQFDTIICLSVVKWVHLNWGDAGLMRLLLKIYNSLKINGHLILDIHSWKSYKKKKTFSSTFQYTFCTITIKPIWILDRLTKLGFELERKIDYGYETDLKRPIYILKKIE